MKNTAKIRLYTEASFKEQAQITLNAAQSHYLVHVMRCKAGQELLVFNGQQGEWRATITEPHKKNATLECMQQVRKQTASPDVWLVFAPVKHKNETIIEKAVELGVGTLCPVVTRNTVVRSLNTERMQARIIEAAEQCGRLDLPTLQPVQELPELLAGWKPSRCLLFADERGSGTVLAPLLMELQTRQHAVLVGPEGGFTKEEHALLGSCDYVKPFTLGPRILRADTAAIASLSCLMAWRGDWNEQPRYPQLKAASPS